MDAAPIPLERLLAHRAWVRSVARAVVRDPNAADDLEQETWVAALATPPRHESSLRGWFGAVVRSRARRAGRTATRRAARESAAARGEAVSSPAELAEIADTHRRVVEAVVALEEPYRAAILLRYFEGLAVDEVARRTASPLETTRSRLKRGVAKLRERLSRELGSDERPWPLALAPLIGAPRTGAAATAAGTGGAIVATKATWAAIGVVVAAGAAGVFALKSGDDAKSPPAPEVANASPASEAAPKPRAPVAVPRPRAVADDAKAVQPAPAPPKPAEETAAERLKRVKTTIDWDRTTVYEALLDLKAKCGVDIVVAAETADMWAKEPDNQTIERLQLDIEVPISQVLSLLTQLKGLAWVVEEPRVVIVPMGVTRDPSKPVIDPSTVPQSPKLTVVGRVVDSNGAAVPGATIVRYPGTDAPVATADVAGRFELKIGKPYGSLEAHAPGQIPSLTVSVTGEPGAQVTMELATRGAGGTVVVRVELEGDPKPVDRVEVGVGPAQDVRTKTPDGRTATDRARIGWTPEGARVLTFDGVAPGTVQVRSRLRGYQDATANVEVVAGKAAEVTLHMAVKPSLAERLKTKRVAFNFQSTSIRDATNFLNQALQLNIVVDPSLAERLRSDSLTLELRDVSVAEALDAICRQIGNAEYAIDEKSDVILLRAAAK